MSLGIWQLERAAFKDEVQAKFDQRRIILRQAPLEFRLHLVLERGAFQLPHSERNEQRHAECGQNRGPPGRAEAPIPQFHIDKGT